MDNILYADYEWDSDDMFVVTPEGNYYNFPHQEYNENSENITITDSKSHKRYTVCFSE